MAETSAAATASTGKAIVAGFMVCLDEESFARVLGMLDRSTRSPLVHGVIGLLAKKHVYVFSVNGLLFVYCGPEPLPVTADVEAEKLVFPDSWRCC